MGYTIYWKIKRKLSQSELKKAQDKTMKVFDRELKKLNIYSYKKDWNGKYFHESFSKNMIANDDFQFSKTARKKYDKAVKIALIELQKTTNNAYDITCDDGFEYKSTGIYLSGEGYVEDYKPLKFKRKKLKLTDLPVTYATKSIGVYETGRYSWNSRKRAKRIDVTTKRRSKRYMQIGTSNRIKDKQLRAKRVGWRRSKSGKRYFENRANRSDNIPKNRL